MNARSPRVCVQQRSAARHGSSWRVPAHLCRLASARFLSIGGTENRDASLLIESGRGYQRYSAEESLAIRASQSLVLANEEPSAHEALLVKIRPLVNLTLGEPDGEQKAAGTTRLLLAITENPGPFAARACSDTVKHGAGRIPLKR